MPTSITSSEDQIVGQVPAIDEERNQELEGCLQEDEEHIGFAEEEDEEEEDVKVDWTRMTLTDEETQWALAIKAAIEADPEIDN